MGCSPSKGRQNGSLGTLKKGRTLLPGSRESIAESRSGDGGSRDSSSAGETVADGEEGGEKRSVDQHVLSQRNGHGKRSSLVEVALNSGFSDKLVTHETDIRFPQETEAYGDAPGKKATRKPKKNKGSKLMRKKEKKALTVKPKVDFPEPLVTAHQAAYAYLNPSITKFEALLGILDQATQTQFSLQPMATFLALRYEEVNCGLKEIAEEGERLLKVSGEHLAWPCPLNNFSTTTSKYDVAMEPPPDLLQQLLQYTVQRMQLVSSAVGGIGDSALEEAVEYFASLSELLDEKLKAKRMLEARLGQILARIESAALRKPGPEDSALFSEDSGIGAENESLAGSDHQCNRRESYESVSIASRAPGSPSVGTSSPISLTGRMSSSISLTSLDSTCTITFKEMQDTESLLGSAFLDVGEGVEQEDEHEEDDEDADKQAGRKRSSSSPPDPCQMPRRLSPKRIENPQNVEMTLKMRDAINGRSHFFQSQRAGMRASKQAGGSSINRPQSTDEKGDQPTKRPQTAAPSVRGQRKKAAVAKAQRSRSAESLRSKAKDSTQPEVERIQKELSQRFGRTGKGGVEGIIRGPGPKQGGGEPPRETKSTAAGRLSSSLDRVSGSRAQQEKATPRRHSSGEHGMGPDKDERKKEKKAEKGPLRATPPPGTPPSSPSGLFRGRNSVKRLIDTFSQGLEDRRAQGAPKLLGPLRGVRKCGVPVIPGLERSEAPIGNTFNSSDNFREDSRASDRTEDLNLDSLPPPPPEVLMDTSFESTHEPIMSDNKPGESVDTGRTLVPKKTTVTQRLRASMQPVTVLPSRNSLHQGSVSMSPAHHPVPPEADPESEEAATLYKQARKIIHLRHSEESSLDKPQVDSSPRKTIFSRTKAAGRKGNSGPSDTVPSTPSTNSQPLATPPSSKARMLPVAPSNPSSQHRRLPSPPVNRKLPTPPPSGHRSRPSPSQIHKSVSPPRSQCKDSSPPMSRREGTPNSSICSYPFKAPSPPASPRVHRWTRENSSEDSNPLSSATISRGFKNARSVFCPASSSLFEAQPCLQPQTPQAWASASGCVLPRPWGEPARGRLPTSVRGPRPFVRRSQSDRRPSMRSPAQTPSVSMAHSSGSEPAINTRGLEDVPNREEEPWGSQSDLRAVDRSASHPDLCIVGQALQR